MHKFRVYFHTVFGRVLFLDWATAEFTQERANEIASAIGTGYSPIEIIEVT